MAMQRKRSISPDNAYEIKTLGEKFDVGTEIVIDAIRYCNGEKQKIEEYLKERTGKGRGNDFFSTRNAPQ